MSVYAWLVDLDGNLHLITMYTNESLKNTGVNISFFYVGLY